MNLINQHIRKHLFRFQDEEDASFQEIVALIQSEEKEKHILLLRYIHLLLDETFSEKTNEPKTLHLHFEYDLDDEEQQSISQFLIIRLYLDSLKNENSGECNIKFKDYLEILEKTVERGIYFPHGITRAQSNRISENFKKNKGLLKFYNNIPNNLLFKSKHIFNCQVQLSKLLTDIFTTRPYARSIEDYNTSPTFNLLNTKSTLNEIDEIDNSIIDNLETVILFDCERKKLMQYFSLQDIKDYDINLRKYLIVSFGNRNNSVQSLRDKLTLIQSRFKTPNNVSYSILQSEIDFVLKQKTKKHIPVSFIGNDNSDLWNAFVLETSIQDLYELRSIKMMNLYSLCFNEEIKDFIFQDIFSKEDNSELISDETKQRLLDLREEDLSTLKELLGNVLDLIISSDLKQVLSEKIKSKTKLIVDDFVISNKKLTRLILSSLSLSNETQLLSWNGLEKIESGRVLILSYQDQGKYPYYFYANVIETTVLKDITIYAIYHKFLFSNRYRWAKHNVAKDFHKLTDHPIRQKYFQWEELKKSINELKPEKTDDTNWDLEQQYSGNAHRETIKLKLKNERERTFNSSELFIYSKDNKQTFRVEKIGDIIEAIDEDEKLFLHNLDKIQEDINLYEKMVDTTQQEEKLNVIRQQFQLNDTDTGRLWKLLLKQKALTSNEESLYAELKTYLESKGLKIVSLHHFKNNWLTPESDSIAPLSKKVFIELCDFLNLPKIYFTLIQRLRNASKQSSRQSTRQMNRLLQDLFNDGSFDNEADINKIIIANLESYKRKHPLDELGIDEKYLGENLIALVELIKAEVTLKELDKFKKVE